jgi:folylpolyglutamate synthase/dihydropteroate synthase
MLFGAIRGKRVTAMLRTLAALEPSAVFTSVPEANAIQPGRLAATWRRVGGGAARVIDDPLAALDAALDLAPPATPVVVCGSLYLVGAVRRALLGDTAAA